MNEDVCVDDNQQLTTNNIYSVDTPLTFTEHSTVGLHRPLTSANSVYIHLKYFTNRSNFNFNTTLSIQRPLILTKHGTIGLHRSFK